MVGYEDPLQKAFVQEGASGTQFDHGRFEIKTSPIYAHPTPYYGFKIGHSQTGRYLYFIWVF